MGSDSENVGNVTKMRMPESLRVTMEAVNWIAQVEREKPSPETVREFGSWVAASPHHIVSFIKQYRIELAMRHVRGQRARARQERDAAAARAAARALWWRAWWKRFRAKAGGLKGEHKM